MDKVSKTYFTSDGFLKEWPVKEKKKLIVLSIGSAKSR
jgi:hypothetical protein